jgi:hypothetical protein
MPLDCSAPTTASTPLQRLTRRQYASTVHDVFAVTLDVDTLTADEKIAAFSANTIAPVSELTVEQYMDAAESVALQAKSRLPALVSCDSSRRTAR